MSREKFVNFCLVFFVCIRLGTWMQVAHRYLERFIYKPINILIEVWKICEVQKYYPLIQTRKLRYSEGQWLAQGSS